MGLLDQLWDDTLAGPAPDSGLDKLRKHPAAFTSKESNGKSNYEKRTAASPPSEETTVWVSKRIMIVKPPGYQYDSPPISPPPPPPSPLSENHSNSEEDRDQMLARKRQAKLDFGLLLLLMTCEI